MRFNSAFLLMGALQFSLATTFSRQPIVDLKEITDYDPADAKELPWETDPHLWELPAATATAKQSCKCGPTDKCWPSDNIWGLFNRVLGGRLIKTIPIASVCHSKTVVDNSTFDSYDDAQCKVTQANWNIPDVS
jgi:hypothetical protein